MGGPPSPETRPARGAVTRETGLFSPAYARLEHAARGWPNTPDHRAAVTGLLGLKDLEH